jgi:hypothetical protein
MESSEISYRRIATGDFTEEEFQQLIREPDPWWLRLLKALGARFAVERRFRRRDPRDDQRNIQGDWERVGQDLRRGLKTVITTPKSPAPQPPPSGPASDSTPRTRTPRSAE